MSLPPAERLIGMILEGGWTVISQVQKLPGATGGNFSVCYIVEDNEGHKAFLKALDYSKALQEQDPARALMWLTEAFNFERDVLSKCKNEGLDKVVVALTDGTVRFENPEDAGVVQYLIFELAEGDVRKQALLSNQFDLAFSLRSLHHVATGLKQIHSHGIAHQDLKPSNILIFRNNTSKIADFGRAAYKGHVPPHENLKVPGDLSYAPIDLLYGYVDPDWNRRRFSCDTYLLGSMAVFFFLGVGMTPLLINELPQPLSPKNWTGTFDEILPYIRDGFIRVLEMFTEHIPVPLRIELPLIVSQLCEPDPRLRGHPKERNGANQYSMERYISRFDVLARYAELGILHLLRK
jgi:eukaryotic-like serine/threonine-protein kinase